MSQMRLNGGEFLWHQLVTSPVSQMSHAGFRQPAKSKIPKENCAKCQQNLRIFLQCASLKNARFIENFRCTRNERVLGVRFCNFRRVFGSAKTQSFGFSLELRREVWGAAQRWVCDQTVRALPPQNRHFCWGKKKPCFFFFEQFRVFTSTCCFFRKFATLPLGMTLRILETGRFADDYAIIPVLR